MFLYVFRTFEIKYFIKFLQNSYKIFANHIKNNFYNCEMERWIAIENKISTMIPSIIIPSTKNLLTIYFFEIE